MFIFFKENSNFFLLETFNYKKRTFIKSQNLFQKKNIFLINK
jgi:hypothetical protein